MTFLNVSHFPTIRHHFYLFFQRVGITNSILQFPFVLQFRIWPSSSKGCVTIDKGWEKAMTETSEIRDLNIGSQVIGRERYMVSIYKVRGEDANLYHVAITDILIKPSLELRRGMNVIVFLWMLHLLQTSTTPITCVGW